ncbi:phosphonate transporter [Xylophilus sp. Kf1]|nr:phosphonate transporter [Xylophilus sp. Kf1]
MSTSPSIEFSQPDIAAHIERASPAELDALDFGIIGFDDETVVRTYNAFESKMAGLSPERVVGALLFATVAQCMNNFMVAQRFEDAAAAGEALDVEIDYVFTLRMRPSKVRLRLVATPGAALRYVLVNRRV